jgi:peptide deformylase
MKLEILKYPDTRLREISKPVDKVTAEYKKLAADMLETMYEAKGIGLAAPQVNKQIRLLVIDSRPRDTEGRYDIGEMTELEQRVQFPLILFNPVVKKGTGKTTYDEGCLSVPGYYETVERMDIIDVESLDENGHPLKFTVDGLLAICIQHEIDHLEGKLFIDRISFLRSNKIKNAIKKNGYPSKKEIEAKEIEARSDARAESRAKSKRSSAKEPSKARLNTANKTKSI